MEFKTKIHSFFHSQLQFDEKKILKQKILEDLQIVLEFGKNTLKNDIVTLSALAVEWYGSNKKWQSRAN